VPEQIHPVQFEVAAQCLDILDKPVDALDRLVPMLADARSPMIGSGTFGSTATTRSPDLTPRPRSESAKPPTRRASSDHGSEVVVPSSSRCRIAVVSRAAGSSAWRRMFSA
jgi:hypothetical protein